VQKVVDGIKQLNLFSVGKDLIRGLINGIGSMAGAVWSKARDIANGIGRTIKNTLGIKSPSRVAIEIGRFFGEGLIDGILGMKRYVERASDELAAAAVPDVNMSYATPSGITARSLSSAVSGTIDVNSRDDRLINAIGALERRLTNLEVVMDGEKVGRIVRPHVNKGNALDATVRRYFD